MVCKIVRQAFEAGTVLLNTKFGLPHTLETLFTFFSHVSVLFRYSFFFCMPGMANAPALSVSTDFEFEDVFTPAPDSKHVAHN